MALGPQMSDRIRKALSNTPEGRRKKAFRRSLFGKEFRESPEGRARGLFGFAAFTERKTAEAKAVEDEKRRLEEEEKEKKRQQGSLLRRFTTPMVRRRTLLAGNAGMMGGTETL